MTFFLGKFSWAPQQLLPWRIFQLPQVPPGGSPCQALPELPGGTSPPGRALPALHVTLQQLLSLEAQKLLDPGRGGQPSLPECAAPHRHTGPLLELLEAEILHPDSEAPSGVKSHFLDIFLEELTRVGADEVGYRPRGSWFWLWLWGNRDLSKLPLLSPQLTAEQNLRFIEPFCRAAAHTGE